MKNIRFNMLLGICFFLLFALLGACGGGDSPITDEIDDGKQDGQGPKTVPPVTNLVAEKTERANELQVSWTNPVGAISVEISYLLEGDKPENTAKKNIRIATEKVGSLLIVVSEPGTYIVTAVAVLLTSVQCKNSISCFSIRAKPIFTIFHTNGLISHRAHFPVHHADVPLPCI